MFKFNKQLWDLGQKIEDETLPVLNKYFNADFKRNNDIFDILDFHDDNKKIICEVKGRRNRHNQYPTTIITTKKITEGLMKIEISSTSNGSNIVATGYYYWEVNGTA